MTRFLQLLRRRPQRHPTPTQVGLQVRDPNVAEMEHRRGQQDGRSRLDGRVEMRAISGTPHSKFVQKSPFQKAYQIVS